MNDFWNERYSTAEFAYGESPNKFLADELKTRKPGTILFPAEGEGRNAVYAATQGWNVTAFDPSIEGQKKAKLLADKYNTTIEYLLNGYEDIEFSPDSFDCIVLIFAHMPPLKRNSWHRKLTKYLKPGGTLLLEGFSKRQIENESGGPKNIDMLFSKEELESDFKHLAELKITETEYDLNEGPFHQGNASVIRVIGTK